MRVVKNYGFETSLFLALNKLKNKKNGYEFYVKHEDKNSVDLPPLINKPLISIILYGKGDFYKSLESAKNQTNYDNFEVIVVSDKDIKCNASAVIIEYGCDINTAFKIGLEIAKGEYIAFMDSNTILSDTAIYYMARQLMYNDFDLIYSDEDIIENNVRKEPFFKPTWSPNTLRAFNYIGFALIKKSVIDKFDSYYEMLVDLSYKDVKATNVERVLVHYINKRVKEENSVELYRGEALISIIIPSKNNYEVLKRCVDSIRNKSTYRNFEIIVVDNGSDMECQKNVILIADKYVYNKMDFNFSKMCNIGAEKADGEFLVFLNDDTEVISENWLEVMAYYGNEPKTGAVGAKLLYPNNKIQHCGVINIKNGPIHSFAGFDDNSDLYFGRNKYAYNYSAVTGACLLIKKNKFNGFNEDLPIAYNDVDLCFTLCENGFYNVVANAVKLYHYESLSRGDDRENSQKLLRLYNDRGKLYKKHCDFVFKDSFYNSNLSQHRGDFTIENYRYINRGKFGKIIIEPEKYFSNSIKYNIEYFYEGDITKIGGYAYIGKGFVKTYILVFTRSNAAIPIEANVELRQDILAKVGGNTALCGFSCNIDTNHFEKGCYQLGIMIVEKFTNKKHILILDKKLDVKL